MAQLTGRLTRLGDRSIPHFNEFRTLTPALITDRHAITMLRSVPDDTEKAKRLRDEWCSMWYKTRSMLCEDATADDANCPCCVVWNCCYDDGVAIYLQFVL